MRVALAYDYLNQYGGGERVLETFMEIFPNAPIYTIFYDQDKVGDVFGGKDIRTSFLDLKFVRDYHRLFIPLMPTAAASLNLDDEFDLIISIGAGYSQGISYGPNTKHIYYCFTPLRYAWESEYIPKSFQLSIFKPVQKYLRRWNYRTSRKPDKIITISNFIARKIKNYWQRDAEVVYPSYDEKIFFYENLPADDYFLAAGRLLHYKKFDLVIEAFNKMGLPLKIVGVGPEEKRLKKIANRNIEFLGFVKDEQLRDLYNRAAAFIFPQVEDFGLVAAEAHACGCPIIAFAGGGALEIVENGISGLFFNEQKAENLMEAVHLLRNISFDRRQISNSAQRFSTAVFKWQLTNSL